MEQFFNKILAIGIVMLFVALPIVAAHAIYPSVKATQGNIPEIVLHQKAEEKSSSSKGCITKWGWNGKEWIKRDLITVHGKEIKGEYCVPFNMLSRKISKKPTWMPVGNYYTGSDLRADWWRRAGAW